MTIPNEDAVPDSPLSAGSTGPHDTGDSIGALLVFAQACGPASLLSTLRSDPARAELQAILAQLDPARLLSFLHKLSTADFSDKREVLELLLAPGPSGSGQTLRGTLQALHRQDLLARIFRPDRVQALRHACRLLVQEPA